MFSELGFAGYLLKPVTHRDLTDCLMMVLGTQAEGWRTATQPIVTRHALALAAPARRRTIFCWPKTTS